MSAEEILSYMSSLSFQKHRKKIIYCYDRNQLYIDDAEQDFFLYYISNPHLNCNIRKLYGLVIDKIRREHKFIRYGVVENLSDTSEK